MAHDAALEAQLKQAGDHIAAVRRELAKVVVGQEHMISRLLIGLFTSGHVLLEGVPGLAKTLTVSTLAKALKLSFQRIQFTPDLLPADLVGTLIYNPQTLKFETKQGPIFANIILADEINRSPAKVQSALLEAMQERQVTIGDTTYPLERPFLVLATQNPVDQEGTYPLPEAQVDRFMLRIFVQYPSRAEELEIMRRMAHTHPPEAVEPVLSQAQILALRELIDRIRLDERLERYIVELVLATRDPAAAGLSDLAGYIEFGASPRATIALNLGARAHALLEGRSYVLPDDIKAMASDVLNHRILLTYEADAEEVKTTDVVEKILGKIPI
ncbi:MAG: MoxR family ATPase [Bacteroidia bacterium]|nr:MoxR family ATPase [Bacteroidia bacterium]